MSNLEFSEADQSFLDDFSSPEDFLDLPQTPDAAAQSVYERSIAPETPPYLEEVDEELAAEIDEMFAQTRRFIRETDFSVLRRLQEKGVSDAIDLEEILEVISPGEGDDTATLADVTEQLKVGMSTDPNPKLDRLYALSRAVTDISWAESYLSIIKLPKAADSTAPSSNSPLLDPAMPIDKARNAVMTESLEKLAPHTRTVLTDMVEELVSTSDND